jgi:hypothetical protein
VTAAIGARVRRVTGTRPAIIPAPAPEARPAAPSVPAHPSRLIAILAMFAVVGAPPPEGLWQAVIEVPRR